MSLGFPAHGPVCLLDCKLFGSQASLLSRLLQRQARCWQRANTKEPYNNNIVAVRKPAGAASLFLHTGRGDGILAQIHCFRGLKGGAGEAVKQLGGAEGSVSRVTLPCRGQLPPSHGWLGPSPSSWEGLGEGLGALRRERRGPGPMEEMGVGAAPQPGSLRGGGGGGGGG